MGTYLLSCMHQPQAACGILEWAVIILIYAPVRIRTRDLWLWYHIELHAPTSSTQKLKLIGKGGQFTYTPTISGGTQNLCENQCKRGKKVI
jgi:hypothetical protein